MGDVSEAKEIFTELKRQILERVDLSRDVSDEEMQELIDEVVISYGKEQAVSLNERCRLKKELFHALRKMDVLQELLEEPDVTEIMVNGTEHIFVEREAEGAGKRRLVEKIGEEQHEPRTDAPEFIRFNEFADEAEGIVGRLSEALHRSRKKVAERPVRDEGLILPGILKPLTKGKTLLERDHEPSRLEYFMRSNLPRDERFREEFPRTAAPDDSLRRGPHGRHRYADAVRHAREHDALGVVHPEVRGVNEFHVELVKERHKKCLSKRNARSSEKDSGSASLSE